MDRYNFKVVEKKWQNHWQTNESFKTKINTDFNYPDEEFLI